MATEDHLLGAMGLDPPCPTRSKPCSRGGVCHHLRQARHLFAKHLPGAVTLSQRADLLLHQFSAEGIGLGVLRQALTTLPPSRQMGQAMSCGNSEAKLEAWRACRRVWAIKAARYVADHGLRYHSHNPNHILALRDTLFGVLGPVRCAQDAQRAVTQALLAIDPTFDAQRGLLDIDLEASQGRDDLHDTLLTLREVLKQEPYRRVLFHPELRHYGEFCTLEQKCFLAVAVGVGLATLWLSHWACAFVVSTALALVTNEVWMMYRHLWGEDSSPSVGLRGWLFCTRYTGRCAF